MRPDGTMRWSLSHGRVVPDVRANGNGKRRFVGVDLDITARKTTGRSIPPVAKDGSHRNDLPEAWPTTSTTC